MLQASNTCIHALSSFVHAVEHAAVRSAYPAESVVSNPPGMYGDYVLTV